MSMFNDISWGFEDNEQEGESNAQLRFYSCEKIFIRKMAFFGPGSEKKWYSTFDSKPQGEWDRVAELMLIKFGESGHPVFRATSPLCRGVLKSKGGGKLSIHFCADQGTIETVFRTIISVIQISIYGAVSNLCEECKTCHVRTGRLVLAGQSDPLFVPSVMKTPIPLTDDPAQEDLLQKYQERVDKLSQQNRVIKFCTDAGFLTTVDVGQYFMTKTLKNSHNLRNEWLVVSTLCHETKNQLTRKVGFQGTPKLENYGLSSQYSDRSSIEKSKAQNGKHVDENTASSSPVWHQKANTRSSIEKTLAKAKQRTRHREIDRANTTSSHGNNVHPQ